jgi:hypothetical protein
MLVIEKQVPSKRCLSPMLTSEFLHRRVVSVDGTDPLMEAAG